VLLPRWFFGWAHRTVVLHKHGFDTRLLEPNSNEELDTSRHRPVVTKTLPTAKANNTRERESCSLCNGADFLMHFH
jgi:hypothetical protein